MVQHLTDRQRLSYSMASNKTRLSQTPGNRIVCLYAKKIGKALKSACGVCPGRLLGVRAMRPKVLGRVSKTQSTAAGPVVGPCVLSDRSKRAVLTEGQKTVVKELKARAQSQKAK
nr:60S ribosomal protein L34-like [Desmodus rotundus]